MLQTQGIGAWPVCGKQARCQWRRRAVRSGQPSTKSSDSGKSSSGSKKTPAKSAPAPAPALVASNPAGDYTVLAGDSLSKIATTMQVQGGWEALYEKNKQYIGDPNLIVPGQKLATK